jgi:hypothetical protein
MKYILILPLLSLLVHFSCANKHIQTTEKNNVLANDSTIIKVFSIEEIKGLQLMLDFFTKEICSYAGIDASDPSKGYTTYLTMLKEQSTSGTYTIPFSLAQQNELFNNVSSQLIKEIWIPSSDPNPYELIATNGKYLTFLTILANKNPVWMSYKNNVLSAGTISASNQAMVILQPDFFDMDDIRVRLLIAIHFFTINSNS